MYEDMMAELKKMAAQVDALETESKDAAANLEKEVQNTLDEKAKHICEFLSEMCKFVQMAKCDRKIDIICYERCPGKLPVSVALQPYGNDVSVWFGYYNSGTTGTLKMQNDRIIPYSRDFYDTHDAEIFREELVTRWNDAIEAKIVGTLKEKMKERLAQRTKAATDKLGAANDRYNKFCGGNANA